VASEINWLEPDRTVEIVSPRDLLIEDRFALHRLRVHNPFLAPSEYLSPTRAEHVGCFSQSPNQGRSGSRVE